MRNGTEEGSNPVPSATQFDAGDLIESVKESSPHLPVIALTPTEDDLKWADHVIRSHDPQGLLSLVHRLFGYPRKNSSP
jgi:hypothetical protein